MHKDILKIFLIYNNGLQISIAVVMRFLLRDLYKNLGGTLNNPD